MIKIPNNCTGCTGCIEICPKKCIIESRDEYGFMVPIVNPANCIDCGLCEKVCPALNHGIVNVKPEIYFAQNPDEKVTKESSSGGIFSIIAKQILDKGGIVYGAGIDYNDNCQVKHIRIDDESQLFRLRGSKYVQSDVSGMFLAVKKDLIDGKNVLFSGTPCQVSGLKRFLRKDYDTLLTVDVVCHGVPSPMIWDEYLKEECHQFGCKNVNNIKDDERKPYSERKINQILFRDKRFGWQEFGFSLSFSEQSSDTATTNSSHFYNRYENPFMKGFLNDLYLRNSCYNCPVKGFSSGSDITLADAWGIENYVGKNVKINRGVSLVIPSTSKGKTFLDGIEMTSLPKEILSLHNPAAYVSAKRNAKRKKFIKLIKKGVSFKEAISVCLPPPSIVDKIKWSINQRFKHLMGRGGKIKNPSVLIIGTGSLLNYGCEAIVQGTYNILKENFPNCTITVASDDIDYDRKVLPDDVNLVTYRKRFTPYRIFKGILRRVFHIGNGSGVRMNTSIGKKYDIVLASGGDNYCETPDHKIYDLLEDLMSIGEKAFRKGNRYILWGASVGPFHDEAIRKRVIDNLSLSDAIFLREELSLNYLSQFKKLDNKLHLIADPAFQMKPEDYHLEKTPGKIYIGVNMSELAVGHSINDPDKARNSKKIMAMMLDEFLEQNDNINLIFIPHVNLYGSQDDMNFLKPLYDNMKHKSRVQLIQPGLGAQRTKGLIAQLDLLIAARMHCCVGGISVGTPTLFITYSNKGRGMSGYAYGHHKYEIECSEMFDDTEKFLSRTKEMIDAHTTISNYLKQQKPRFESDSLESGKVLKLNC